MAPAAAPHVASRSALDWPALQQAVSGCQACKLCEGRKNTVFGVGQPPPDASAAPRVDWLIVGEAPGENEDRTGEPFVGQAGQLLDNMLKAMGLARHDNVYIANVIKCRPPGNRNPEVDEVAQCEPYLRRQIELLQPKIILAMGRFAVNSLLQASVPDVHKLPLGKLRGKVHHYTSAGRSVPVVATYHPAYLLRNLPEKAKAWADLCLAMQAVAAGDGAGAA
jgi:uracil-DNA glycosylase